MDATKSLRTIAREVLSRDDVACLIGYERGTYGFRVAPCVLTDPAEVDRLVFSPLCVHNLVNYLTLENSGPLGMPKVKDGKIAVVVKGCDSRAIAMVAAEHGIDRSRLVVIGVHSPGVVDMAKLEQRFPDIVEPAEVTLQNGACIIKTGATTTKVPADELLSDKCLHCKDSTPVVYDELVGARRAGPEDTFADVAAEEARPLADKAAKWRRELSRCIRCYACRNACPLCYCSDCVLDRLRPQFVRRTVDFGENLHFHITRAFHLAGRCIGCGECQRVCPQGIPLMDLNRKLAKDVKELFGYEAGTDPEAKPLFATFKPEDPDEGIL
jgi:ferredoxin